MTIDEAIEIFKLDKHETLLNVSGLYNVDIIAWLEELKDLRKCVNESFFLKSHDMRIRKDAIDEVRHLLELEYAKGINDLIRAGFDHYLDTDNKVHDVVVDMQTMAEMGQKLIENVAKN